MLIERSDGGERLNLSSPTALPKASAFLWNKKMMIHMNCRGYAVAQFMQPEPAKYAYAPNLEAKTFMQPEQPYYAHHPGRFFYIKDEATQSLFSAPYEPVRADLDHFTFSAGKSDIQWILIKDGIKIQLKLTLPLDEPMEIWEATLTNESRNLRKLSLYPYFPIGYMSWMNQSGWYDPSLNSVVCKAITPYQKLADYRKIKTLKDYTYFMADRQPDSWEVNQAHFEGEGGLHAPTGVLQAELNKGDARYETPAGIMQFRIDLKADASETYRFLFGPAFDEKEIKAIHSQYLGNKDGIQKAEYAYLNYLDAGEGCLTIETPDPVLDNLVNHWLPRQVYYHGETNRLSTDPQTRNYLQDNMGMAYIQPEISRNAFLTALSQQEISGAMPDGILIQEHAELKYINQIPHTDHCVWLPICLKAYLDETDDYALLDIEIPFGDANEKSTVAHHIDLALKWLVENRDERGLNYINQGDWCDPMNMVGPKGVGVSGWLSMATSYAIQTWLDITAAHQGTPFLNVFQKNLEDLKAAINEHLWDGEWYARGITDDHVTFGISKDEEGKIFLNPQGWAFLCGCASDEQKVKIQAAVAAHLETPYGVQMLAPAFTSMREDVGRVTQKHPGSAENGSIYNHAAAFYVYGLYQIGATDKAFDVLRKMIPGPDQMDLIQRGQLPVFIPNYYRGAYQQFPRTAGRSSQLFNTGTVHWMYRALIDGLFGLQGSREGLSVCPNLPAQWQHARVKRVFRGATFNVSFQKTEQIASTEITVDNQKLSGSVIRDFQSGRTYEVKVLLPAIA
ncbi:MAG: hypothetical protein R8G66_21490 [Cytophagales bacterium]|nr:hypothetical protein [Cytophagales bacterium]